jgi:hypothetical protein
VVQGEKIKYDLLIEGTLRKVKPLGEGSTTDAVEDPKAQSESPQVVVYFAVDKVVTGRLPKVRIEPASKFDQMQDAFQNKEYHRLLLQDFKSTPIETPRRQFRVAVHDSMKTFGIENAEKLEPWKFRLYCRRYRFEDSSYVMVKAERLLD